MIELSIRVQQSLFVIKESKLSVDGADFNKVNDYVAKLDRKINMFRVIITMFCFAMLSFSMLSLIIVDCLGFQDEDMLDRRVHFVVSLYPMLYFFYLTIPIILTILIILIVKKLKSKQSVMHGTGVSNIFGKETRNVLIILALFDLSFLVRFTVDYLQKWFPIKSDKDEEICSTDGRKHFCYPFTEAVYDMIT